MTSKGKTSPSIAKERSDGSSVQQDSRLLLVFRRMTRCERVATLKRLRPELQGSLSHWTPPKRIWSQKNPGQNWGLDQKWMEPSKTLTAAPLTRGTSFFLS